MNQGCWASSFAATVDMKHLRTDVKREDLSPGLAQTAQHDRQKRQEAEADEDSDQRGAEDVLQARFAAGVEHLSQTGAKSRIDRRARDYAQGGRGHVGRERHSEQRRRQGHGPKRKGGHEAKEKQIAERILAKAVGHAREKGAGPFARHVAERGALS